mgnify:FL=1
MTNNNQNSEDLDRIDTGELSIITPDTVADVTDESVAEETVVINAELEGEALAEEESHARETSADFVVDDSVLEESLGELDNEMIEEAVDSLDDYDGIIVMEEKLHEETEVPSFRHGFRGYNVNEVDAFLVPLVEKVNSLEHAQILAESHISDLTSEVARLLEQVEENKATIATINNFNLTDEVKVVLEKAELDAKAIIINAKNKVKELVQANKDKDKTILDKAHERAEKIIAKAKMEADFKVAKSEDKLKHAEEIIAKEIERAHDASVKVKDKAKAESEKIIEKAHAHAEKIIEDTNAKLVEAKEYIAQRHEVHNRLQDFYKSQREFLSNRD